MMMTCGLYAVVHLIMTSSQQARARSLMGQSCVRPDAPVRYLGWQGTTMTFDFSSPYYAGEFMIGNAGKLLNLEPAQRNWLHETMRARGGH